MSADVPEVSEYRFAPLVGARLVGGLLVALAALLAVATLVVAVAGLPLDVIVVVALLGIVAVVAAGVLLRRVPVVRLAPEGYRVRLVRGAGATTAAWTDVAEAATATPDGLPVVVIRLEDGRTTTIPVTLLATDREQFVRDLQAHLQRGQGLRPLS